jgi:DNA-binding NtrC family response regulator
MANKIRVLVVDDEIRFLKTLAQRLELRGLEVEAVPDGQQAVEAARKQPFDLALLDLKMPGMSGEQVLEILKAEHPDMEVVILTGHGSIDSAVACTRQGAYGYLQKPCDEDELFRILKEAYQKRVQRKLQISREKMEELLAVAPGQSALSILRKLKEIEEGKP